MVSEPKVLQIPRLSVSWVCLVLFLNNITATPSSQYADARKMPAGRGRGRGRGCGRGRGAAGGAAMSSDSEAGSAAPSLSNTIQPSAENQQNPSASISNTNENIGVANILQQVANQMTLLTQAVLVNQNNATPDPPAGSGTDKLLQDVIRMRPPQFDGASDPSGWESWIFEIEKVFEAANCS
ncbi:hypothetical protein OROMI_025205 [Orobanche minor]